MSWWCWGPGPSFIVFFAMSKGPAAPPSAVRAGRDMAFVLVPVLHPPNHEPFRLPDETNLVSLSWIDRRPHSQGLLGPGGSLRDTDQVALVSPPSVAVPLVFFWSSIFGPRPDRQGAVLFPRRQQVVKEQTVEVFWSLFWIFFWSLLYGPRERRKKYMVIASLRGNVPKHGHVLSPTLDNSRSLREVYREHEHFCQIACRFWRRPECSSEFSDWQDTPRVDED